MWLGLCLLLLCVLLLHLFILGKYDVIRDVATLKSVYTSNATLAGPREARGSDNCFFWGDEGFDIRILNKDCAHELAGV